ncbi:MAG: amino acid adenylation domain-containing protein, partial [bacterium]|nr:amino acid adenylation domain-containing protein [bacterium]
MRHPPPAAGGVPLSRGEFGALKLVELNRTTNSPLERGTLRNEGGGVSHGNLAYIIYTSGSTGKPKGVMVEHRGIVNTSLAQQSVICQGETDNILQFASLSFDASAFEIFMALLSGASLVTVPAQVIDHVPGFIHHLYKYRVTIVVLPPVYLNKLEKRDPGPLRLIFTAGEAPVLSDVIHYSRTIDYINGYGPTETSIWASYSRPKIDSDPHIGKPISNTYIYITDRDLQPVPVGVTGEICIGGAGLARGYIDRPQLTAQRFIPNPFQKSERLYKTGDLGRWLPGGDIQFLGRRDYQVKIRGFRIELGEIEHRLTTHPDIMECAAVAVQPEGTGPKELASFVVCNPGSNPKQEPDNTAAFREYLSRFLPLYMIPSYFVSLDRLPVNASGKIDRKALSRLPLHISDPRFQSAYISPRNRVEQVLAEAWEEVLGRERVSMEDNFFEMGGDSIKAIQIASKLHRHGMKVAVKELFGHPTISGLSPFVKTIQRQAQQETVAGNVSLTPIQRWFFEREFTNAHHFNQSVMLYKEEGFETALLETVFTEILRHHDALRMVFLQGTGGVAQVNRGTGDADGPLFHLDVVRLDNNGDVPLEVLEEIIKTETNQTQAGINPEQGPLVKLKLFKTPDGDHLLIVVHHLVMDGVSWRILLEDLDRAYRQLEKGEEIVLPPKTDSFQYWAEKQEHYAAGGKVSAELPYWKRIIDAETGHLSRDTGIHGGDDNKQEHGQSLTVDLTKEETNRLLHQTRHAYNTEINDLLLTALALSLRQWRGMEKVRVNLEGHGREDIIDDVDIGRTIGWFTTQFPVLLETSPEKDIAYHIQNIKETLHGIPNKGIGFGILKYLSKHKEELASYEPPDIGFNYLGDFQQGPEEVVFQFSPLSAGDSISPEMERFAALNITGILVNRQLTFRFDYNRREYRESSIHQLAELFKTSLLDITRHCTGIRETQLTPSDYGDHQLSLEDLEKIRPLYSDDPHLIIDKIYSLGPMQEGLLFHRLLDDQSAAYFEQTTLYLEGNLDPSTMECSINSLIHRHDILRTSFVYREIKEPRQVVFKERPVTLFFEDLSGLKEEEQERHIMEYNEAGKKEGFHLTRDPLLRFALFKLNNHLHALIWSHHHILMDGWCIGILLNELLTGYQCLAAGKTPDLPVPLPYRDYIRWLERQDREEGLKYWKTYLEGYDRQVVLPQFSRQEQETSPGTQTYRPGLHRFTFDERLTSALEVVAGAGHVTLNTLFQTGWAIILQRYNNCDDVVFGSVVSGRSAGIPGIETMIGLFINTLPVRIKSGLNQTFRDLLKEVQEQAHLSRANENVPLARVQSVSPLKGDLINHLVIFENYPFEPGQQHPPGENSTGFTVMGGETDEQTHYDFNIMVVPGPQLTMTFRYNKNRYDAAVIQRIGSHLEQVLGQVSSNRDIYIKDIQLITPGEKQLLLEQFNDTQRQLPENKTVAHLFEEQVVKRPDRISTAHPRSAASVTYKQLNESSNRLALLLKESGLEPGEIVAIMTERS